MSEMMLIPKADLVAAYDAVRAKGVAGLIKSGNLASKITSISSGGGSCPEKDILKALIDGSITELATDTIQMRDEAFVNCEQLTTIIAPNIEVISENSFKNCKKLKNINFQSATKIKTGAFSHCNALEHVTFLNVQSINDDAFRWDYSLIKADFSALTFIAHKAFAENSLSTMIIRSPSVCKLFDKTIFANTPIVSGTGYVYVPKALVDQYKADPNWATYATQIRAIEDYPDVTGG